MERRSETQSFPRIIKDFECISYKLDFPPPECRQCQRFMADSSAFASAYNPDVCHSLRCRRKVSQRQTSSPNFKEKKSNLFSIQVGRSYKAGPALDGTPCKVSGGKIGDGGEEEEEEYDTRALYSEEGLGGFCAAGDCVKSETRMGSSNAGESEGEEEGWSLVDIEECKSGGDFL